MINNTPNIHVKIDVFRYLDNKEEHYDSFASMTLLFRTNCDEHIKVDGHPFIIQYNFPNVNVLYDHSKIDNREDILASVNIDNSEEDFLIEDTSLNGIGYMFRVLVTKDKEPELE